MDTEAPPSEVLNGFSGDIFNNFLDDEIPQDIFDDIMNDVNFNAMGFDMNSLSSEDSGQSSSSFDDQMNVANDNFFDQSMVELNANCDIKEEPVYSPPQLQENVMLSAMPAQNILIQQPTFQSVPQPQQHVILQQPNIVVKHEKVKVQQVQPAQQQILIGGNLYTVAQPTTTATAPLHTIVNGTTGILTKIPIVPVTRIQPAHPPPPKASAKDKKKSGHNIIERRYRTSINDKITELKNLVSSGVDSANAKMNKSGILKRSIDRIRHLESENAELRRENESLRQMLSATVGMPVRESVSSDTETIPLLSPPHSDLSSTPGSPSSIDSSGSMRSLDSEQRIVFIQHGISPHNKFALCIFMFAVVALNNFGGLMLNEDNQDLFDSSSSGTRRTILSAIIDDPYKTLFSWKSLMLSLVNVLILFACIIKLLVYGEPVVKKTKCAFTTLKGTAEMDFNRGEFDDASTGYNRLLQQYGINLPTEANIGRFECCTITMWQAIRMIMYRLPFGLWLARKVGGLFCPPETRQYALKLTKEIGWVLHRLNQLNLIEARKCPTTETNNRQGLYGTLLSLYAINMCETAEQEMQGHEMSEVYLTAALRAKSSRWLKFLGGYYMRKAKHYHFLDAPEDSKFDCLFSEYGYRFVVNKSLCDGVGKSDIFDAINQPKEPISHLKQEYRQHVLEKSIEALLGLKNSANTHMSIPTKDFQKPQVHEVLTLTKLLMESFDDDMASEDNYFNWLTHVLIVATHWMMCDFENADLLAEKTRKFPSKLLTSDDHNKYLLKALFTAFMAKRELMQFSNGHPVTEAKLQLISNRCNIATCLLKKHLAHLEGPTVNVDTLTLLLQMLTCDWLLETRTECWETLRNLCVINDMNGDDEGICNKYYPHIVDLENFQSDLNSMMSVVNTKQMGQPRVLLYEAIYRLMAGATPLQTHHILSRNIEKKCNSRSNIICTGKGGQEDEQWVCGERERALSIYFACRYLPDQMGIERAGLLTLAAETFKQIGDTKKMNECIRLVKTCVSNKKLD